MSSSRSQRFFQMISLRLPKPIVCKINRWSPGCLMRFGYGIQQTYPDDIYLVSYPRSGNTWTRFIVSYLKSGVEKPLSATEVSFLAPDIYQNINQANALISKRVIKSHSPLLYLYPRVVFVHRDPRESLVSYWHFAQRSRSFSGTFSCFLRSSVINQYGSWKKHMQAMQQKVISDPQNIHVIRYDGLKNDFHNTVADLIEWIGFGANVDLDRLYELTSMEVMSKNDHRFKSGDSFFVDRGKGLDWRSVWTQSDLDWLEKDREMKSIMEENGYR